MFRYASELVEPMQAVPPDMLETKLESFKWPQNKVSISRTQTLQSAGLEGCDWPTCLRLRYILDYASRLRIPFFEMTTNEWQDEVRQAGTL